MASQKVWLGVVDDDFKVKLLHVQKTKGNTHDEYGLTDGHTFRVVDNIIFWWDCIPNADIKDTVIAKLQKKTNFKEFSHKVLDVLTPSYIDRFYQSHGYESDVSA